jgi:hypothetical protein
MLNGATLSERDARQLITHVTERLRVLGTLPASIGVALDELGLVFTAVLHGKQISVRTTEGTVRYDTVAKELLAMSLDPDPWCDRVYKFKDGHDGRERSPDSIDSPEAEAWTETRLDESGRGGA